MWAFYADFLFALFPPVMMGVAGYVWARGWMRTWSLALYLYGHDYDEGRVSPGDALVIGVMLAPMWPLVEGAYRRRCERVEASLRDEAWQREKTTLESADEDIQG